MKKILLLFALVIANTSFAFQTSNLVFDVDCNAGTENFEYCYDSNDSSTFTFTSTTGATILLEFAAGTIESGFDDITVYDSADNSGTVLFTGDNGGDLGGLTFQSTGDSLFIEVSSDGSVSCQSSSTYNPWSIDYRCITCIEPTVNYNVESDCANGEQFLIDVQILDTGDAVSIDITDDQGSAAVNTSTTGTFTFGPFPNGTEVNFTVADADDINCTLFSGNLTQGFCPDQACDIVNAGEDMQINCETNDDSIVLNATFMTSALTNNTSVYNISTLECPLESLNGTPTGLSIDDRWSEVIELGFNFEFFGLTYDRLVVGANGLISFDIDLSGEFCPWSFEPDELVPTPDLPTNAIFGAYHDIDPSVGGAIEYTITGVAPERQFNLSFVHVPHFSCNDLLTTSQIILYESANVIDVIVEEKPTCASWNDGLAVIGVQNSAGNVGYTPAGRNTGAWNVSFQELWRFIPDGDPNYVFEWLDEDGNVIGTTTDLAVNPAQTTTYTASVTYTDVEGTESTVTDDVTVSLSGGEPTATTPGDLANCDASGGLAIFDLTLQDAVIIGNETDVFVTYYLTQEDADADENAIENPSMYQSTSDPETIYFRLERNEFENCFSTGSFDLNQAPVATTPPNLVDCSTSENGIFNLTNQDAIIIGSETDVTVTYYETEDNANAVSNVIDTPSAYQSATSPQTIYFRLERNIPGGCFSVGTFDLIQGPTVTTPPDLVNCDNGTGTANFDLTTQDALIIGSESDVFVSYFETEDDATMNTNEITNPDSYQSLSSSQTIYFKLEREFLEGCFTIGNFNLEISNLDVNLIAVDQGCTGDEYMITISPVDNSYNSSTSTFEWFGPIGADLSNNTSETFVATVDGTYTVEITTDLGCVYSKSVEVMNAACAFPQGISPNGDNLNDTFDLRAFNVLEIEIFNRQGRSVYKKQNYTDEWEGQSPEGELTVGTYYYVARLADQETRKGWVYIQR